MRISEENAVSGVSPGLRIKIIPLLTSDKSPGNNDMETYCSMLVRSCFVGQEATPILPGCSWRRVGLPGAS